MKSFKLLMLLAAIIALISSADASAKEFYQLKTYTFISVKQEAVTDNYIKAAFLPAIKRLGIKNAGVFKPRLSETDTLKRTVLLIPFASFSQFQTLQEELAKDETYLTAGKEYLNANFDQPPYLRTESVLLEAFKDMPFIKAPALEGARANRVYELRSYESATEAYHNSKVDMFNAGGEIILFERLKFNAVFYARVISGPKMPNLMYMISFADEASRKAHWDSFSNSPEWTKLKALPKYLNTVSHIDVSLLYPTDYSDF